MPGQRVPDCKPTIFDFCKHLFGSDFSAHAGFVRDNNALSSYAIRDSLQAELTIYARS